jgi:hypothetical protein
MLELRFFVAWRYPSQVPDGFFTGLGSRVVCRSAHRKETKIRTPFERPARVPMWIAGISICLLAASGIAAIVRSIPASYASIPNDGAPAAYGTSSSGPEDSHANDSRAQFAATMDTINRRNRARCDECGVVESMRQVERAGDVGGRNNVVAAVGGGVPSREPERAIAATSGAELRYEFTVRFRDGSNKVFNDTSPRAWPLGSRVIVIGRSKTSNN